MRKIEFEGEIYYYDKGKIYDGSFLRLSETESAGVYEYFLSNLDLRNFKFEEFIALVNGLDDGGQYNNCVKLIEKGFEIYFDRRDYAKILLPKLFRLYRMQNLSEKIIELWNGFWCKKTDRVESSSLYVVLGAACCDLGMPDEAERYAKLAYRLQGGKADEYLSNIYIRVDALKK